MRNEIIPELGTFLTDYPDMTVSLSTKGAVILSGSFSFLASPDELPEITDTYSLKIEIQEDFPSSIPMVYETKGKIPRDGNHHVNPAPDNSLCLGSPLRLKWKINNKPTIVGFAEECLVPYLYSISHKLNIGTFPFGELDHGTAGIIEDYVDLMNLPTLDQVRHTLFLLGKKKRWANKKPCPCGCGKRLGACHYHFHLIKIRKLADRSWFKNHLSTLD